MPSIEIVCVGQTEVKEFSALPFRVLAENRLVSHRSPHPLFQDEFNSLHGCIYHICNPEGDGDNSYELLDTSRERWSDCSRPDSYSLIWGVHFLPIYAPYVRKILEELLKASPEGHAVFTSDYQFGPRRRRYKRPLSLDRFWELHDANKLHMNALYPLHDGA